MKHILFILLVLKAVSVSIYANDTIPGDIKGVDRIIYYNEHAKSLLDKDPEKSRLLATTAMELAEAIGNYEELSNALNYIGLSYYNESNYDDAIKNFQQSLRVSLRLGARDRVGNLFQKIGMSYLHQKDYQKAIFYYQQTAKVFEQLDYRDHLAKIQFELGVVYFLAREFSNAINILSSSVENYSIIENYRGKAQVYNQIGMTYEEMGDLRKSLMYFQKALQIHQSYNNRDHLAFILNNMGRIYTKLNMLTEAEEVLENAIKYCSESYFDLFAEIKLNQGKVVFLRQKYEQAEADYNAALRIADSTQNRMLLNKIYESYYLLYKTIKNSEKALKYYQLFIASKSETYSNDERFESYENKTNESDIEGAYYTIIVLLIIVIIMLAVGNIRITRKFNRVIEIIEKHNLRY